MARVRRAPTRGAWLRRPGAAADAEREELARCLAPHELAALGSYYWEGWARDAQLPPREAWRTWLICAGRGFGKTRAGAEWVRDVARHDGTARIALVGASLTEVRNVMVEGDSGVLAAAPGALAPVFEPSLRKLTWENGAIAWLYSAGEPESLRGPQHSHAWCDEIAKWENVGDRALAAWNNLQLDHAAGRQPPRARHHHAAQGAADAPAACARRRRARWSSPRGRTTDNRDILPADYLASMIEQFDGQRFGRQELDGELIDEVEGALWTRALLDRCREGMPTMAARAHRGRGRPARGRKGRCLRDRRRRAAGRWHRDRAGRCERGESEPRTLGPRGGERGAGVAGRPRGGRGEPGRRDGQGGAPRRRPRAAGHAGPREQRQGRPRRTGRRAL